MKRIVDLDFLKMCNYSGIGEDFVFFVHHDSGTAVTMILGRLWWLIASSPAPQRSLNVTLNNHSNMTWFFFPMKSTDMSRGLLPNIPTPSHSTGCKWFVPRICSVFCQFWVPWVIIRIEIKNDQIWSIESSLGKLLDSRQ